MRAGWIWLASFGIYPLIGAPILQHPAFRAFGRGARVVLAAGLGAVLLSWTMTVFALFGWRWSPWLAVAGAAFAFAFGLRSLIPKASRPSPRFDASEAGPSGGRRLVWFAHAVTALSVLAVLAATVSTRSTSLDLLLFWGPKAQQFAAVHTIDADYLRTPSLGYLHVYYPPLVANVFAFGAMIAGRFPWVAATLTFPLLLSATAVALFGILNTARDEPAAAATTALVVSAIALPGILSAVAGNAEPFLFYFEVAAIAVLLTPAAGTVAGTLLAGCLIAGAANTKIEWLPFVLGTTVIFPLLDRRSPRPAWRSTLFLMVPTLISVATWLAFGATRNIFYGYKGYGRFAGFHWDHTAKILTSIGSALWNTSFALPFIIPLIVLLVSGRMNRMALLPLGVAGAMAGYLVLTYLLSESFPRLWISWSAARVFSPVTAMVALASFCAAERAP